MQHVLAHIHIRSTASERKAPELLILIVVFVRFVTVKTADAPHVKLAEPATQGPSSSAGAELVASPIV